MKKIIFIFIILTLIFKTNIYAMEFLDIEKGSWYEYSTNTLISKNIINGYSDNTFKPNNNVRVDEFIKMAVTALGYKLTNDNDYWATNYINKAKELKLVLENDFYDYKRYISRAEMSRILIRSLSEDSGDYIDYEKNIRDIENIDKKYLDYVLKGYAKGLINGINGEFKPNCFATRKEAAVMIHRLIDKKVRVENKKEGKKYKTYKVKDFIEIMTDKGYSNFLDLSSIENEILTRQLYGYILYHYIYDNIELKEKLIPIDEKILPYAIRYGEYNVRETPLYVNLFPWFPYGGGGIQFSTKMAIRDYIRTYANGRKDRILIYNPFLKDNDEIIDNIKDMSSEKYHEYVLTVPKMLPYDHKRFKTLFSDSKQIDEKYSMEMFKLYHFGVLDMFSYDPFSIKMYISPNARITIGDIDRFLNLISNPENINVIDEKGFGMKQGLIDNMFGDGIKTSDTKNPITMRIPYLTSIYNYDQAMPYNIESTRLEFAHNGIKYQIGTYERPYFGIFIYMEDIADERKYSIINQSKVTKEKFEDIDIPILSYLIPFGYKEVFLKDIHNIKNFTKHAPGYYEFIKDYGNVKVTVLKRLKPGEEKYRYKFYITYVKEGN